MKGPGLDQQGVLPVRNEMHCQAGWDLRMDQCRVLQVKDDIGRVQ